MNETDRRYNGFIRYWNFAYERGEISQNCSSERAAKRLLDNLYACRKAYDCPEWRSVTGSINDRTVTLRRKQ